ncbi:MAG: hypothetical protein HY663_06655 [Chloroflexi bacterium]|nr:hypothetical protein [Chloroflexota bacterium]
MLSKIGFWAFIVGLILSVIGGLAAPQSAAIVLILIILGLLIGLLNITGKETMLFLVATIALIVVGRVFEPLTILSLGKNLDQILAYVATLMAPGAIVAAIKALWAVGKPGDFD